MGLEREMIVEIIMDIWLRSGAMRPMPEPEEIADMMAKNIMRMQAEKAAANQKSED